MAQQEPPRHPRKRRRRRQQDKAPLSAKLVLDAQLKGDVGLISEDLLSALFPGAGSRAGEDQPSIYHVAITPFLALSIDPVEEDPWAIIPVAGATGAKATAQELPPATLRFPSSSLGLQTFARALQALAPQRPSYKGPAPIEIRVLDVVPLGLESVFVTVDEEIYQTLDSSNGLLGPKYGFERREGIPSGAKGKGRARDPQQVDPRSKEERLRSLVRGALKSPRVVHAGDLLPLPLAPHPITHVPPPPVKISLCEPVAQGLLSADTTIIVTRNRPHSRPSRSTRPLPVHRLLNGALNEEDEDTSDDRFYSAAEDGSGTQPPSPARDARKARDSSTEASESDGSDAEHGGLSDDSMDDMITLTAPLLPPQTTGALSAFQPGTPHGPGGRRTNGVSTPGSVFSNYTSTTARPTSATGRLLRAQGLEQKIPEGSLHPRPAGDEDDEARVYVDVSTLVKIGCFSGDWVGIEPAAEPKANDLGTWGLGALEGLQDEPRAWRAAKVYGLPEGPSSKSHRFTPVKSKSMQTASHLQAQPSAPPVYLSPVLLANLSQPSHLRLSPLKSVSPSPTARAPTVPLKTPQDRLPPSSLPPYAKEVTLLRLSTPLASDRALQTTLLAGLRAYFERKQRLVKTGDLVAVTINTSLGKAILQGASREEPDAQGEELLSEPKFDRVQATDKYNRSEETGVAWFRVGQISQSLCEVAADNDEDPWGGVAAVDSTSTRMVQAGSTKGKFPGTVSSTWPQYLGIRRGASRGQVMNDISKFTRHPPKPYISPLRRRLRELVAAATSARAIHLKLPALVVLVSSTQRGTGKAEVATRACADLGIHTFAVDAFDVLTEGVAGGGDVKTEALLKARMATALKEIVAESRVIIATTTDLDKVAEGVRGLFTHELEMSAPDEGEREGLLRDVLSERGAAVSPDVDLGAVAIKTAALVAGDLVDVVDRAVVAKAERIESLIAKPLLPEIAGATMTPRDVRVAGGDGGRCLAKADFEAAVDAARNNFADAIGAPKIPNVGWDDVGGLSHVKDAVMETIQLPLERPELFAKGMKKRSGILFYGPPGTGKTLLAKAIATEFSLNFFSIKGPELLNMYIGESEANVRRVFQRARDARPCVVFFDELDSVAPKRGNQGDSGGVMDRIVSQLLAELDGMSDGEEGSGGVFVIGATNRPDLLDAALLRPGRFDKMLYLGISDTHDKQLKILEALTRKFTLHPEMSLPRVAQTLPFTYTGADLYALCSDAMLKAITRQALAVDEKIKALPGGPVSTAYFFDHFATKEDTAVMVTEDDFFSAQRELVGSVSVKELEHYDRVRKSFEATDDKAKERAAGPGRILSAPPTQAPPPATAKGKGRAGGGKGKGKGKATTGSWDSPDPDEDDEPLRHVGSNGHGMANGTSKAQVDPFVDPSHADDDALYG
ncbi:MAG: peroxisomal assembly protein [Thelocarpon impressellum]|nr:MAG: peroxisomal assembly protein [Thelocarpon impressellum]